MPSCLICEKELVEKGLAIPNFDNCKKILKKHYNIPEEKSIIVKNLQINPKFNLKNNDTSVSDSANFEFYNPITKEKLKEELADVFAYALLLAEKHELDVKQIVLDKIARNAEKYPVEKAKGSAQKYTEL